MHRWHYRNEYLALDNQRVSPQQIYSRAKESELATSYLRLEAAQQKSPTFQRRRAFSRIWPCRA